MAEVHLSKIVKRYGPLEVVHGIDLDVAHNEFVVLVGPSGCGKSTTLRMIAGLEEISGGTLRIGDRIVNDLPPRARNISMVFQSYALYPHMTVRENLGFGLKIAGMKPQQIVPRVDEAAAILGLETLMDRLPQSLSGGQRQRVAMGRAIVRHPDVFLFDEPLSNLDAKLRGQMRVEIKKLHQRVETTIIYVTHDQVEAMTLADRIVIMRDGHVEQVGTPDQVFNAPANTFVAGFIGSPPMNLIAGEIEDAGGAVVARIAGQVRVPLPEDIAARARAGRKVTVGFRPDAFAPRGHSLHPEERSMELRLRVALAEPLGTETIVYTSFGGQEVIAKMLDPRPLAVGEELTFTLDVERLHVFDAETGQSLRS